MLADWHAMRAGRQIPRTLAENAKSLRVLGARLHNDADDPDAVPPPPDLGAAIRALRNRPILSEQYKADVRSLPARESTQTPRTSSADVPAPPDLGDAIRRHRGRSKR
jgi:hypothetical protein